MVGHEFIRLDMNIPQDRARLLELVYDAQLASQGTLRPVVDVMREKETE